MTKEFVPERSIGTRLAKDESGLGVELVDVVSGKRTPIEHADAAATAYIADDAGLIRMKVRHPSDSSGNLGGRKLYYYREPDSEGWNILSEVLVDSQSRQGYVPVALDAKRNVAYGFDTIDGFDAVVETPLTESGKARVVMARNDVDVDELIRIGRQRRVVGASYATEKRAVEYFDPALAALAKNLQAALPGKPLVNIVGANADESKLLIIASSDVDPGMVYLYDQATRELNELLPLREHLVDHDGFDETSKFSRVRWDANSGVSHASARLGWEKPSRHRPAAWRAERARRMGLRLAGAILRGPWVCRAATQLSRVFGLWQRVVRPQRFPGWETAIGDINDAGRWLVAQGVANPGTLGVVGWSYGGYAALQSQVADPSLFKAVVAIAPVTDLEQLRTDARDYTNYSLVDSFIGQGPHVKGGSPAQHAEGFAAPVLLFHGSLDQNVSVRQSRLMADRLEDAGKKVEYVEFEGLDHSLSDSASRAKMLAQIDRFLAANLIK